MVLKLKSRFLQISTYLLTLLLLLGVFVIALIAAILLTIWRQILDLILRFKLGEEYGGLLVPLDNVWYSGVSKGVIHVTTLHESSTSLSEFVETIKQKMYDVCFKDPEIMPKFSHIVESYLGTCYMRKNGYFEDFVRVHKTGSKSSNGTIREEELQDIVQEIFYDDLPLQNKSFVHVLVLDKPVELRKKNVVNKNKTVYAFIVRLHHSLGDGYSVSRFFNLLAAKNASDTKLDEILKKKKRGKSRGFFVILTQFLGLVNGIVNCLLDTISELKMRNSRENLLKRKLTGEKIVSMFSCVDRNIIKRVKKIKNHFAGASFQDILLTAVSAACSETFEKEIKNDKCSYAPAFIPTPYKTLDPTKIELTNSFSNVLFKIPLIPTEQLSLEARVQKVMHMIQKIKTSPEILLMYYFLNVVSLIPLKPLRGIAEKVSARTAVVSILPGPDDLMSYFGNGRVLKNFITLPISPKLGFTLCFFSEQDQLQLSLVIDKALAKNADGANSLLTRILDNIDEMYEIVVKNEQRNM